MIRKAGIIFDDPFEALEAIKMVISILFVNIYFLSLMSYSLLWFVKINTELLRGVFTTQRFDTPV